MTLVGYRPSVIYVRLIATGVVASRIGEKTDIIHQGAGRSDSFALFSR